MSGGPKKEPDATALGLTKMYIISSAFYSDVWLNLLPFQVASWVQLEIFP